MNVKQQKRSAFDGSGKNKGWTWNILQNETRSTSVYFVFIWFCDGSWRQAEASWNLLLAEAAEVNALAQW